MSEKSNLSLSEFSKEKIAEDLRNIGIREGDHLAVALSFRSIGRVKGGPDAFIDAILDVIGPTGTLMMNTYSQFYHAPMLRSGRPPPIFDHKSSPATTGVVPETLRKRPGAIRSQHPVCSITAFGNLANFLTDAHDGTADLYSPYSRLGEIDGKVLYIGLGNNLVALCHEAQNLAGLLNVVPLEVGVFCKNDSGEPILFTTNHLFACVKRLPDLVVSLRNMGLITDGKIGNAPSILVPAKETLNAMVKLLRENPTLNLCSEISCVWCRELERRLDLYDRIENPALFQKNASIIQIIALVDRYRLSGRTRGAWPIYKAIGLLDRIF
jgi:aminoglycoside 3-N-acetyltransferase